MAGCLAEVIENGWDVYCCILLFRFFAVERNGKNKCLQFAYACVLTFLCLSAGFVLRDRPCSRAAAVCLCSSVILFLLFRVRCLMALVLSMLCYGLDLITEYMAVVALDKLLPVIPEDTAGFLASHSGVVLALASSLLLWGSVMTMGKMAGGKSFAVLTAREWWALFVSSFVTVASFLANSGNQSSSFLYLAAGMLIIDFIVYYMVSEVTKREMKQREDAVFHEKIKNETAMYRSMSENLDRQRRKTHEYKNQIAAIRALAAGGKYQELGEYVRRIDDAMQLDMDAIDANNVIVNAILNTKYREAAGKGIVLVLKVNDLSELNIQEEDIVVILSNLLNNALEACESCVRKVIRLKFVLEEGQVVISVRNSIETKPLVENGEFVTTKENDADEHGVGIRNVVETVEKYKGRYVIDYDKGEFLFSILISNPVV